MKFIINFLILKLLANQLETNETHISVVIINNLITLPSESDHNQSTANLKRSLTFMKSLRKENCSMQCGTEIE